MPRRKQVDIGIITIREDEFEAVLQRFPEKAETVSFSHRRYRIRRLELPPTLSYTIAIVRCSEQGNGEAQAAARDFLEDLNPSWLFVVGIAGGVPANEFSLGDVIVSTRIADFTVEAVLKDRSREYALAGGPLHPDVTKLAADIPGMVLDHELDGWNSEAAIGMARPPVVIADELFYGDDDWQKDVRAKIEHHFQKQSPRLPLVTAGPIACSDRLIKETEILRVWLKMARQIQAVEMESAGVYRAVHGRNVPFLAIRGISDVVGYKRHPEWTAYACQTAAAFLFAFLCTGILSSRKSKSNLDPSHHKASNQVKIQAIESGEGQSDAEMSIIAVLMPLEDISDVFTRSIEEIFRYNNVLSVEVEPGELAKVGIFAYLIISRMMDVFREIELQVRLIKEVILNGSFTSNVFEMINKICEQTRDQMDLIKMISEILKKDSNGFYINQTINSVEEKTNEIYKISVSAYLHGYIDRERLTILLHSYSIVIAGLCDYLDELRKRISLSAMAR